jgi:hypothetical protein
MTPVSVRSRGLVRRPRPNDFVADPQLRSQNRCDPLQLPLFEIPEKEQMPSLTRHDVEAGGRDRAFAGPALNYVGIHLDFRQCVAVPAVAPGAENAGLRDEQFLMTNGQRRGTMAAMDHDQQDDQRGKPERREEAQPT